MDHEVERRLEPIVRSAHEARDTHRAALTARDALIAELRASQDDLRRRLAESEAGNRDLRAELAQRRADEPPGRHREREAPTRGIISDLFRCLDCSSLWLLSTWPDQIRTVCRPVGPGCPTCADQPLRRLREVKASVVASGTQPAAETPDAAAHTGNGTGLVAGLLKRGPEAAIARTVAHVAGLVARQRLDQACAGLSAIADGLDRVPNAAGHGIAWCATGIAGAPEFPAKVLSETVTRAELDPVNPKAIARAVRLVGAATCAADDRLDECRCARRLAFDGLAEPGSGVHRP